MRIGDTDTISRGFRFNERPRSRAAKYQNEFLPLINPDAEHRGILLIKKAELATLNKDLSQIE